MLGVMPRSYWIVREREDAGLAWGDGRSDGERGHSGSRVERVWSHGE